MEEKERIWIVSACRREVDEGEQVEVWPAMAFKDAEACGSRTRIQKAVPSFTGCNGAACLTLIWPARQHAILPTMSEEVFAATK